MVVDLRHLPRPVAFRELYGYGAPHRPTGVESAVERLLAQRPVPFWPTFLLPTRSAA